MRKYPIHFIDSTLREGEQSFGFHPTDEDKIAIAERLTQLGCDSIELGHPIVTESIAKTAKEISERIPKANGLVHSLLREEEIYLAKEVGAKWIGFFLTIHPEMIAVKYGRRFKELVGKADACIQLAHDLGLKVRFTCEDASRTPLEDLLPFYENLIQKGADLLGYADTTGSLLPMRSRIVFRKLIKKFPEARFHFHGHNDRGLALANALEAVDAGFFSFDASVLGLGERGGIVPLTESAVVLAEQYGKPLDLSVCQPLEDLVWNCINMECYRRRRFAHKAGLHCLSVIDAPDTYESIPASRLGGKRITVLSKYSGKRSLQAVAKSMGVELSKDRIEELIQTIKKSDREFWREEELAGISELDELL